MRGGIHTLTVVGRGGLYSSPSSMVFSQKYCTSSNSSSGVRHSISCSLPAPVRAGVTALLPSLGFGFGVPWSGVGAVEACCRASLARRTAARTRSLATAFVLARIDRRESSVKDQRRNCVEVRYMSSSNMVGS